MALLTKDQLLAKDRLKTVDVPVPEWGGDVRLKELTADERDAWESMSFIQNDDGSAKFNTKQVRSRLLVRCMVDADGKRMFSDDEIARVGSLSASAAQRLFTAASKLNAISKADVDDLEKNSEADPSAVDSSTSASGSA